MKQKYLISILILFFSFGFITKGFSQLNAGDIAFVAFNSDGDDDFAIVALDNIPANTTIYITDNESDGSGGLVDKNEGTLAWSTGASIIPVGTVVVFNNTNANGSETVSTGTVSEPDGGFNITDQDGLIAFLGTDEETPTSFIAAIQIGNDSSQLGPFDGDGITLSNTGLVIGNSIIIFDDSASPDGAYYNGNRSNQTSFSNYYTLIADDNLNWSNVVNGNGETHFSSFSSTSFTATSTWNGSESNDWTNANNWNNGVPGADTDVTIPDGLTNYPNFNSAVTVNSMIIEDGATFISTASFTGDVTLQKDVSATQWTFVSSPVINETYNNDWVSANSVASGSGNNRGVSTWNNDVDDPTTGHWRYLQAGNSGTFNTGQGYSIYLSSAATVNFQGSGVHTSSQTTAITQGTSNNFNLVGNPFTAYLNLGDFFTDNGASVINDAAIYVWNGSSYETKLSGTDAAYEIAPGQGFFVSAAADTNLTFDVNDLSHQTQIGFGKSEPRPEIRLLLNDTYQEKFARILYINGTTTGFDLGYDGKLFSGVNESFSVFSHLLANDEGDKYQIQSLPNTNYENMVIPIGIDAEAGKEITFSAEITNLPSNLEVTLEDREKNTFNTLNTEITYTVKIEETTNGIGRFYLHTKPSGVLSTNAVELENVIAYTYSNKLRIVGLEEDNIGLKMYNVLGKEVLNTTFNSNGVSDLDLPKTSSGVYIITISSSKGKLNKKIIIE